MIHGPAAGNSGAARGAGGPMGLQDVPLHAWALRVDLAHSRSVSNGFQGLCSLRPRLRGADFRGDPFLT